MPCVSPIDCHFLILDILLGMDPRRLFRIVQELPRPKPGANSPERDPEQREEGFSDPAFMRFWENMLVSVVPGASKPENGDYVEYRCLCWLWFRITETERASAREKVPDERQTALSLFCDSPRPHVDLTALEIQMLHLYALLSDELRKENQPNKYRALDNVLGAIYRRQTNDKRDYIPLNDLKARWFTDDKTHTKIQGERYYRFTGQSKPVVERTDVENRIKEIIYGRKLSFPDHIPNSAQPGDSVLYRRLLEYEETEESLALRLGKDKRTLASYRKNWRWAEQNRFQVMPRKILTRKDLLYFANPGKHDIRREAAALTKAQCYELFALAGYWFSKEDLKAIEPADGQITVCAYRAGRE